MEQAYKDYADIIYRYAYTLCNNEHTAEELTQETFFQAVRCSKKYDGTCKVSTWLCQITKHLWYQELDKRHRKQTVPLDDSLHSIPSEQSGIEDQICVADEKMALMKKIHVLDDTAKEVLLLRITGAFSFREIGDIFNKNENWARVTFYRAKQKIMRGE